MKCCKKLLPGPRSRAFLFPAFVLSPKPRFAAGTVVMFPGEFRTNPGSPYLQAAGHDVPWEHPALVRDGLEPPWSERGWLAQVRRRWRTPQVSGLQRRGSVLAGSN